MQIIKLTPVSFKIILTREDIDKSGIKNPDGDNKQLESFLTEIIEKAGVLYGIDFDYGCIDADFFESKDGSGELFVSKKKTCSHYTYMLKTSTVDAVFDISCRLKCHCGICDSRLYLDNTHFLLLLYSLEENPFLPCIIKEYGEFIKPSPILLLHIEEHAKCLIPSQAVKRICSVNAQTKDRDIPL